MITASEVLPLLLRPRRKRRTAAMATPDAMDSYHDGWLDWKGVPRRLFEVLIFKIFNNVVNIPQ